MTQAGVAGPRIAVVGAGLAGLRAATALVRRGLAVTIFEARAQVGGRATGRWEDGHWMDAAWPMLGGRDRTLARWAGELGLGDSMWPLRPVKSTLSRGGHPLPIDAATLSGVARMPGLSLRERARLLRWDRLMGRYARQLDPVRPELAADLDFRSIRDHVSLYFGQGPLDLWLGPEIQPGFGDRVDALSRVALLRHCRAAGIGERRPAPAGLPRRPLFELAQTAAEGLDCRLGTAVERVDEEPSGGFRLEARDDRGQRVEACFDAVVMAVGASRARSVCASLLTPAERDFLEQVEERTVVSLALAVDGVTGGLPQEIRVSARDGSAISSLVVEPGPMEGRVPEGRSQVVALARDGFAARWSDVADDVVAKNLMSSVERHLPGLGERVIAIQLGRFRGAPFFGVGHYRGLDRFRRVQVDRRALGRRLYWAADHLCGPTFEESASSGARAASDLIEDLAAEGTTALD